MEHSNQNMQVILTPSLCYEPHTQKRDFALTYCLQKIGYCSIFGNPYYVCNCCCTLELLKLQCLWNAMGNFPFMLNDSRHSCSMTYNSTTDMFWQDKRNKTQENIFRQHSSFLTLTFKLFHCVPHLVISWRSKDTFDHRCRYPSVIHLVCPFQHSFDSILLTNITIGLSSTFNTHTNKSDLLITLTTFCCNLACVFFIKRSSTITDCFWGSTTLPFIWNPFIKLAVLEQWQILDLNITGMDTECY